MQETENQVGQNPPVLDGEKRESNYENVNATLITYTTPVNKVLSGRLSFDEELVLFEQNQPRASRSRLMAKYGHSRLWKRHDGTYHLTCNFKQDEQYLTNTVQAEVRLLVKKVEGLNNE